MTRDGGETANALQGLLGVLRMRPQAFRLFGETPRAALRSFRVALYLAPVHALQRLLGLHDGDLSRPDVAAVEILGYLIGWTLFPVVMLEIAKLLDLRRAVFRYLAAYNWFQLVVGCGVLPILLLHVSGFAPPGLVETGLVLATAAFLMYGWFIARHALGAAPGAAAGIVCLDILLSLVANGLIDAMAR